MVPAVSEIAENRSGWTRKFGCLAAVVSYTVLLLLSVMSVASGSYNPFIYFQF